MFSVFPLSILLKKSSLRCRVIYAFKSYFYHFFFDNQNQENFYCYAGKTSGVCISPGGRFPPFQIEGKSPRKVSKGPRDLTLCRVFRKNTCCDVAQTLAAFLSIRRLASSGEATPECLQLWELLECSICDPRVGVQPGPPVICASLCDRVYEACSTAYFSMDVKTQV